MILLINLFLRYFNPKKNGFRIADELLNKGLSLKKKRLKKLVKVLLTRNSNYAIENANRVFRTAL